MPIKKKLFNQFRMRRLAAFLMDVMFVLCLIYLVYAIAGFPNFPAVFEKMRLLNLAGNDASHDIQVKVMAMFNTAHLQTLLIWICYDVFTMLLFRGSTPGKLIMKLRLVPANENTRFHTFGLLVIFRSLIKFTGMFLLQGIPFVITTLSVFADEKSTTGYERMAKLHVKNIGRKKELSQNV